jgi:hypothetical protein
MRSGTSDAIVVFARGARKGGTSLSRLRHSAQDSVHGEISQGKSQDLPVSIRAPRRTLICAGVSRQARDGVGRGDAAVSRRAVGAVERRGVVRAGARAYLGPRPHRGVGR